MSSILIPSHNLFHSYFFIDPNEKFISGRCNQPTRMLARNDEIFQTIYVTFDAFYIQSNLIACNAVEWRGVECRGI